MDKEIYTKEELKELFKDPRRYSLDQRLKVSDEKRFKNSPYNITKKLLILLIAALFEIFFSITRFENRWNRKIVYPKKILVIKLEHIGDVILSTPVYRAIKKYYPNTKLYVATSLSIEDTLKNNPYIDGTVNINPKFSNRSWDKLSLLEKLNVYRKNIISVLKIMIVLKPDITINLRNDYNNVFFNYFSGARIRVGDKLTPYNFLLTDKIDYYGQRHEISRHLELLQKLGIKTKNKGLDIFPGKEEFDFAEKIFKENSIRNKDTIVCMHIGGSGNVKWWPIERFAKISDYLIKKYNAKIILLGKGRDEEYQGNKLKKRFKKNVIKSFNSSVLQKAALIKKSNLLICNDSGPMHIGAAIKTPMIALFGPGAHKYYRPLDKIHTVIYKHLPCSPCAPFVQNDKNDCPENTCMKLISVKEVIKEIDKKLKKYFYL